MKFKNKTILITGGTGSFGNVVLKRFLKYDEIKEIRIFSRDETKQHNMRLTYNNPKIKFIIGNIRDKRSIDNAMIGVDLVFHAAALKYVPSCEFFPIEAVKTNILGCENVLDSAIENNVSNVIILSTDKAVYPINAMGLTKAIAEKTALAKSPNTDDKKTTICCTRYGNVMASRGSVIPLFVEQIKNKKPITITDPSMTRFMMTLEDAVDLVFYAFENGKNGDIFIPKAPATTIETLAKALNELYNSNAKIKIIGVRHGEKQNESLISEEEMPRTENLGDYFRISKDFRDLNYDIYYEGTNKIPEIKSYSSDNTKMLNPEETKELLLKLDFIKRDLKK